MKTEISVEDLKGKSLFVATPMYGASCSGYYTKSVNDLAIMCTKYGIELRFYYLFNESLITRARNYAVDEFLRSGFTHLMFIDSDIGFDYRDVIALLDLCEPGYDVVTGPYPKKAIAWEKVKKAVEIGYGQNPFELAEFGGDFVFNAIEGTKEFKINEPVEISEGGTGFMMIRREVFEKFNEHYPEQKYLPDHVRSEHFDGTNEITAFFDCIIAPDSRRYLSEDYMFCHYIRKIGMKVWMCPWMKLSHVGVHIFTGSMGHMAAIAASPTADETSNEKNYKPLTNTSKDVKLDSNKTESGLNRATRRAQKSSKKR